MDLFSNPSWMEHPRSFDFPNLPAARTPNDLTLVCCGGCLSVISPAVSLTHHLLPMSTLVVDSALRAAAHLRSSKVPTELAKQSAALFSAYGGVKHALPDLPYDYNALARKCFS